jgi:hypothetical protein
METIRLFVVSLLLSVALQTAGALAIGPGDFQEPAVFDFSDLTSGTRLAGGLPNPYAAAGVQFTGYVTTYEGYGLHGNHLATAFANDPAEPFVVRARLLHEPALRLGAYVWPEYGETTTFTTFDDLGQPIERLGLAGAQFAGLEASFDRPIRYVEWRGLDGCTLTTFPRVDGVMIDFAPEPATLGFLGVGGLALLFRRRRNELCRQGRLAAGVSPTGRTGRAVAALLVFAVATVPAHWAKADIWFLGIGNDGYYTDVTGLHNAYCDLPNPHGVAMHSRLLSNRSGSAILSDIGWLADNAGPGDLALFYYSGHGGTTYDYNHDEVTAWPRNSSDETIGRTSGWVTDDQVTSAVRRVDSQVPVIVIFDSCYAGGMVGGYQDMGSLSNVFVMMSSREDQVSYGGYPYSRFTQQLVNGLGCGLPADLDYARLRVSGQTPQYFDAGGFRSLSLVPVPEPTTLAFLAVGALAIASGRGKRRTSGTRHTSGIPGPERKEGNPW